MEIKDLLKGAIDGTGELTKDLSGTVKDIIKNQSSEIHEIFYSVIELGDEGVGDISSNVRDSFIGSVQAFEESGKSAEESLELATNNAEKSIEKIAKLKSEGIKINARQGIDEAKKIIGVR